MLAVEAIKSRSSSSNDISFNKETSGYSISSSIQLSFETILAQLFHPQNHGFFWLKKLNFEKILMDFGFKIFKSV